MNMATYLTMANDDLADYLSDYYKSTYGFRPCIDRLHLNRQLLIDMIVNIDKYHAALCKTFAGREALRVEGWSVPETDPEFMEQARLLAEDREVLALYEINRIREELGYY